MTTLQLYKMTCTCGQKIYAEASSREEALYKIWHDMEGRGLARHMRLYHPRERIPTPRDVYRMIDRRISVT